MRRISRFVRDVWKFLTMDAREFNEYAKAREEWPTHDEALQFFHGKGD